MASIEVIYEDNHLLVINKAAGMPSQEDNTQDLDVITAAKAYLKEKYKKPGNVFCGLVHRLDRPVSGLMVLAKTSKAAARLQKQFVGKDVLKQYHCVVKGYPSVGLYEDTLLKDKKTNTTFVSKNGKLAQLNVVDVVFVDGYSLCTIQLLTGRSHQIRVQMASRNLPIINDHRYNKDAKVGHDIALFASTLSFTHPTTKQQCNFTLSLPTTYPWDLFSKL